MNSSDATSMRCSDGLLVPAMRTTPAATLFYLLVLLYCFLGIAIAADVFMCSIEKITSATRKVRLRRSKKNRLVAEELMGPEPECTEALGSSAPEILLSIIEIVGNSFRAGDLGPGTIVG
uniref:Sodium/calcium exchanger membrane region domain-containing protein n=1 Tax=Parascaris equorum TaxID=6256 RepID=A0A914RTW9_PAREQ